jgi:8-oxo-dGTP pyrophosphatase MutT (NUDIX family)
MKRKKLLKKVRAIIYDIKDNQPYFLILHRVLRWQGWEFVKETLEPGENIIGALKRGIKEETGLKNFEIIKSLDKQEKWQVLGNDYFVMNVFLVKADMNQKISLKQKVIEHDDYQWLDKETALKKLTWPESRKLLKELKINETS